MGESIPIWIEFDLIEILSGICGMNGRNGSECPQNIQGWGEGQGTGREREMEVRTSVPRLFRGSGTLDARSLNDLISSFVVAQRTATWAIGHRCTSPKMGVLVTCLVSQFATWLTEHLGMHQSSGGIGRTMPQGKDDKDTTSCSETLLGYRRALSTLHPAAA